MKRFLFYILLFTCSFMYSQSITVNTNTYSVPQLINNVLINSPCINTSNITWSTGTNFGSTNGIGYFENTNPNFPMQSGVILSTGNVLNASGPNTSMLSDGTNNWSGDSQLESVLAQAGINMNSVNATTVEFNFVPISQHFDFDFLFASEEYGNFQCSFSDAFAFLLTNLNTGVTTNLAVVPGTNSPISVVTIRDLLYNSGCTSENAQFFGNFNGGSNAAGSATNFNGQTVVMNASAVLEPNVPYKIKLVIADRTDFQSDSAIFLSSNSFNIGQLVLPEDVTVAANTAPCFGDNYVIQSGLNPAEYTFVWKKDGQIIDNATSQNLTITQAGTYELTYTNIAFPCQIISDSILVEYQSTFTTSNPIDLYRCDSGAAMYNYNLAQNTTLVTQGLPAGTTVSYHNSFANADAGTSALPSTYNSAPNETVFVRIKKPNSNCYVIKSFQLLVTDPPVVSSQNDFLLCSSEELAGHVTTDLHSFDMMILNGLSTSIYQVNYYANQSNAATGTNALNVTSYDATTMTLYASVELITESSCRSFTPINIVVTPLPNVDLLEDVITCVDYTLQPLTYGNYFTQTNGGGTALFAGDIITTSQTIYIYNANTTAPFCKNQTSFRVIIIKPDDLPIEAGNYCNGYSLPELDFGGYYSQAGGQGQVLTAGTVITQSQVVYFYISITTPAVCVIDLPFQIDITQPQQVPDLQNVFDCTEYTLQPLSFGNYYDQADGQGNLLVAGTPITSSKTIYIHGVTNGCPDDSQFEVVIGVPIPQTILECSSYTLPDLVVGGYYTQPLGQGTQIAAGTIIEESETLYFYAVSQNQPNCSDNYSFTVTIQLPKIIVPIITPECYSIVLPSIPVGTYYTGSMATGNILQAGDIITASTTLFIYIENANGCKKQKPLNIVVFPAPIIDSRADIDVCNSYILTNLQNGNYFTGTLGTGTMLNGGDVINTNQTIYIYSITNKGCYTENSFNIIITPFLAQEVPNVAACDGYILPPLNDNNIYYTDTLGPYGTGTPIPVGTLVTSTQTIYIFRESASRNNCYDENSFTITIVPHPTATAVPTSMTTVCDDDATNDGVYVFDLSTLNATVLGNQTGSEFTVTYFESIANANDNINAVVISDKAIVFAKVTNTIAPGCPAIVPINIIVNKLPEPSAKDGIICVDNVTQNVLSTYIIESGLSPATHTFEWFNETGNVIAQTANYEATTPGIYSLIATSNATGCPSKEKFITVNTSQLAIVGYTISDDFGNNQTVTINATGTGGDYEYQLDDGLFQDSPVFNVVSSGTHTITVRDKNGCGIVTLEALIVNYPRYFTPNGDGFHETWNIVDLNEQLDASIIIYDRFGKILKQIKPSSEGWDGKYNNKEMLSDDYWFVVNYTKNDKPKEFKAHFSLKR